MEQMQVFLYKVKQNILFLLGQCGLLFNKNMTLGGNLPTENISDSEMIPIITTSNIVYKVKDGAWYFRECRPHLSQKNYVEEIVADFEDIVIHDNFKPEINRRKFFQMGNMASKSSNVYSFFERGNASILGIRIPYGSKENVLRSFVNYAWSEVYAYQLNRGCRLNFPQVYNAVREICFYQMACLLNVDRLVPKTYFVALRNKEKLKIGTRMDGASGIPFLKIMNNPRTELFQPLLQRELLDLQLLDVLCFEKDHRPDNYNVIFDSNGKVYTISVFDNDSPLSFFVSSKVSFETYEGCSPFITRDGSINRPFLDADVCDALFNLTYENVHSVFSQYLSEVQIKCLYKRIRRMQFAIEKGIREGTCRLLSSNEWDNNTVEKELGGDYGLTYLGLFSGTWKNNAAFEEGC